MIHFVSTCTNRKTVPALIRAGDLKASTPERRAEEWVGKIAQLPGLKPASDIYAGDLAKVAVAAAQRQNLRHFICSAGYGLVGANMNIAGYSATFSWPHADEVTGAPRQVRARREWWQTLRRESGAGAPRLSTIGSDGPIIVAASPPYLDAMHDELVEALESGVTLVLVTSGRLQGRLQHVQVPSAGRLRGILGGSLISINVRVAARIMDELSEERLTVRNAREVVSELAAQAPEVEKLDRRSLSDDEVVDFILRRLLEDRSLSHTHLLRVLRDSGLACEQGRFRSLYRFANSSLPTVG